MSATLHIVKIGGRLLDDPGLREQCLKSFSGLEGPAILVHGGGSRASSLAEEMGVEVRMIEGRRITDDSTLEIALMVYAGLLNTRLVAELQALGCPALGLSGADGDLIRAHRRPAEPIDFGWVGDIDRVNGKLLYSLAGQGLRPVLCALTHDGKGNLYNTNADTIAAEVARALASDYTVNLWYCFEKEGVLGDVNEPKSLVRSLDQAGFERMRSEGSVASGMVPKLHNAFRALQGGVNRVAIGKAGYFGESISTYTELVL